MYQNDPPKPLHISSEQQILKTYCKNAEMQNAGTGTCVAADDALVIA